MTADAISGMLDIGEHCKICHQRDFLPFICPFCKTSFCQSHKLEFNDHHCKEKTINKIDISHLPSSKLVFPNLEKIRGSSPKPKVVSKSSIGSSQKLGGNNGIKTPLEIALQRLKKLIPLSKKPIGFKMAERVNLRKVSKGDIKIKIDDRVYIWCSGILEDSKTDKKGIWLNKNWSVGKTLDYLADQLKFQNLNNLTMDNDQRLFLFDSEFKEFKLSKKVSESIKEGDIIYLVKGGKK